MPFLERVVRGVIGRAGKPAVTVFGALSRSRAGLSAPLSREAFLATVPTGGDVLEIGPFDTPLVSGPTVAYFDVLDREGLRKRAVEHGRNPAGVPHIDYVSEHGDLAIIERQFDAILSSHAIEHQHDLIKHLKDVERLLKPGSSYYVIAPDKRYCFDHFQSESRASDVLASHYDSPRPNIERAIHQVYYNLAHNDSLRHWLGMHGSPIVHAEADEKIRVDIERFRGGEYRDIHAWQFTPASFRDLIHRLHDEGKTTLKPSRVHDTMFGSLEFYAVLKQGGPAPRDPQAHVSGPEGATPPRS